MEEVQQLCDCSTQQALRLLIGMGTVKAAVAKGKEIAAWRAANRIEEVRNEMSCLMSSTSVVEFPKQLEVYTQLIRVRPCALRAVDGSPVSLWHAGSLKTETLSLSSADIKAWSHAVFEYKDLWVSKESEDKKVLMGYIQVYDMRDVSLRQLSSREVVERMKLALEAGSYYMEAVSHMYVINASILFSLAWKA